MDAALQIDHQAIDVLQSPNGEPGVVVRALLTVSGAAPTGNARAPLALSFVLDRSGSMALEKIEAAKMATWRALERLHPDDVVSVVTFDHLVECLAAPARRAQQTGLMAALQEIDARGTTNLSGGWLRGRQDMQAAQGMIGDLAGSSRRILLLTDGHANAGITEPATLIELARLARAQGITTTTIGIGEGYDDALLRAMADAGGGNAWYIERPDQSHDVLAAEIGDLLSVSAQGVTVSLDLHEAVQIFVTHSDWPTHRLPSGSVHFDLGDLYAAEPKPLLVELFVPAHKLEALSATSAPLATLTVQANVMTSSGSVEFRTLRLPIASTLEGQQLVVPEIEHAVLLARTAKAREAAARYQREGDATSAERVMREATSALASSPLASNMKYSMPLLEEAEDMRQMAELYSDGTFSERDAKYQMQRSYNTRRGKQRGDEVLRRGPAEA